MLLRFLLFWFIMSFVYMAVQLYNERKQQRREWDKYKNR